MQRTEIELEAERLVTLQQTIWESAQVVYGITEKLVDSVPDETRNPKVDVRLNFAYDDLMQADKLIQLSKVLLSTGAYPSYVPAKMFWANLERRSDEQRDRLDRHLRFTCLRDPDTLQNRRDAAEAVIDGMLNIYQSRDVLFFHLDRNHRTQELSDYQVRVMDGVVESSLDFIESIAGVVRQSTQIR